MTQTRLPRPRRCIGIADDLHKRLRQRALDEDASIADVVERALVRYLSRRDEANEGTDLFACHDLHPLNPSTFNNPEDYGL